MCGKTTASQRGIFTSTVIENKQLCSEHFCLQLAVRNFPPCGPGNFLQVECSTRRETPGPGPLEWKKGAPPVFEQSELVKPEPFLRRPFSLAGARQDGDETRIEIIYRVVGIGTESLAGLEAGSEISVIGPLGNMFPEPEKGRQAVLVGGGVGIPPLVYLARHLADKGAAVTAFFGFTAGKYCFLSGGSCAADRKGRPSFCCGELEAAGISAAISSDDGTIGYLGLVTSLFGKWLKENPPGSHRPVIYGCGPEPMLKDLAEITRKKDLDCYLSMERYMACGMGTCQSCAVKIFDDSDAGWSYKLCCSDGPVFEGSKIDWK